MKQDVSKYVGQQIRKYRLAHKMTQKELGLRIGVKHNTISSYEKGTNEPEQNILFAIAKALNISINDLFPPIKGNISIDDKKAYFVAESKDKYKVPDFSTYPFLPVSISAGIPIEIDALSEDDLETISIPDDVMGKWAGRDDIFIMRVNGESMNKIIPHNSLIAVKKIELDNLKNGDIVVYSDNVSYAVKHFYIDKANERLIFRPNSTDTNFTDYIVSYSEAENVKIHGKVVVYVVEMD